MKGGPLEKDGSSLHQTNPELDKLWAKEAESRIDAYDRGRLNTVLLEAVMQKYGWPVKEVSDR